ncbi:MAG: 3-oxoacid CoA-transferase subunit A [Dehalococcoidia bacterium]|nr:3-oxoacid CoA-transferase subunit A [Dehalococcoidia bacterium]
MAGRPVYHNALEAIAGINDGATVMIGGFAARGVPTRLVLALRDRAPKDLTIITNDTSGGWGGRVDCSLLVEARLVRKVIASWPVPASTAVVTPLEQQLRAGEIELEVVPQGTLAERIRAAGAGIGAFYTPTGVGTPFAEGKEVRSIDGQDFLLEYPLSAGFALIRGFRADTLGNLVYRKAARNFNPPMATAARVTIAEVDAVVPAGDLDPEAVVTPGIYVHRLLVPE